MDNKLSGISSVSLNLSSIPYLDKLTAAAWFKFVDDFEAYQAKDGQHAIVDLISSAVLRLLSLRLQVDLVQLKELNTEKFVTRVSEVFAPASHLESYDRFKKLSMYVKTPSLDAVMNYILEYEKLERRCEAALPPDKKLRKLFVKGLRPARLAERVEFAVPGSLAEAKVKAMEEVERLARMSRELSAAAPASRTGPVSAAAEPKAETKAPGPVSSNVICYACGEKGHKRGSPQCSHTVAQEEQKSQTRVWKPVPGTTGWNRDRQGRLVSASGPTAGSTGSGPAVTTRSATAGATPRASPPGQVHVTRGVETDCPAEPSGELRVLHAVDGGVSPPGYPAANIPRWEVQVTTCLHGTQDCERVAVKALLDTGATASFIAPKIYQRLAVAGAFVRDRSQKFTVAGGGTLQAAREVRLVLQMPRAKSCVIGKSPWFVEWFAVLETGEDLVLGYPFLHGAGLLNALTDEQEEGRDEDPEEDPDQGESVYEMGTPDGVLPTVPEGPWAGELHALLSEYADVFGPMPEGGASVDPMPIVLTGPELPRPVPPRRLSPAIAAVVGEQVGEWLRAGVVKPSTSPCAAPVVVVRKHGGGYRVCVDYRSLNSCTLDMKFPVRNTKALLERMAGKRVFGTLDLRSGFHQVPLEPEAQYLTAFATPEGLFEFTRVQFGLKNGPSYFQRCMTTALNGLAGNTCEVFIDDVIVYAETFRAFLGNLRGVLARCREFGLRVNGSKCELGLKEVTYLGHRVNGQGITLTPERRRALLEMTVPDGTSKLRAFMGLANYFRAFVPRFAVVAAPLNALCSKKANFIWGDEQQDAFDSICRAIADAPLLAHLDYSKEIVLRTDASCIGLGGVLLQRDTAKEEVVCFVSKAFSPAEQRWSTIEQEAYAVFFCVMQLRHHLLGHAFTVETDHRNLLYMQKATAPKVVRWRLRLMEFDFRVVHIAGQSNTVADALSRCLKLGEGTQSHVDDMARFHNGHVGHRGVRLMEKQMREAGLTWEGMRKCIGEYVSSCPVCQKTRLGKGSLASAVATTTVREPFHTLAVDTIGPLPADKAGMRYVVVTIDCFTRFIELWPAPAATALDAARALTHVFGRYGAFQVLRSDQGMQYAAQVIDEFLKLLGIERQYTPAYRPEANGIVERANGEIGRHLRALLLEHHLRTSWSEVLPVVQRIVNATPHSAIGMAPVLLMFGGAVAPDRELLPLGESDKVTERCVAEYWNDLQQESKELVLRAQEYQDRVVSERSRASSQAESESESLLEVGDYVLVSYPSRPPSKIAPRWRGPLIVTGHNEKRTYCDCQDLTTLKVTPMNGSYIPSLIIG